MTDEQIETLLEQIEQEYDSNYANVLKQANDREFCVRSRGFQFVGYTDKGERIEKLVSDSRASEPHQLTVDEIRKVVEEAVAAGAKGIVVNGGFDLANAADEEEAKAIFESLNYDICEDSFWEVVLWERE